jgi:O-antigen/teichoic acid export membrane protein
MSNSKMKFKLIFKNKIANLAGIRLLGTAINFLIPIFVSNAYNLGILGQYYIFVASIYGFSLLARLGLDYWIVKEVSSNRHNENIIYYSSVISSLLLSIPLLVVGGIVQFYFSPSFLAFTNPVVFFVGLVSYSLIMINVGLLRGVEKEMHAAVYENFLIPLFIMSFIAFDFFGHSSITLQLENYFVFSVMISLILSSITIIKSIGFFRNDIRIDNTVVIRAWPFFGVSITSYAQNWLATVLISMNLDTSDVATFNICQRLIQFSNSIQNIIGNIYSPKFGKSASLNELKLLAIESRKVSFKIGAVLLFSILITSPALFFLVHVNYVDGFLIILVLSLGYFFSIYCGPVGKVLSMSGNVKYERNIQIFSLLLSIVTIYMFTIYLGILGAAIAMSLSLFISNSMMVTSVKKQLGFTLF